MAYKSQWHILIFKDGLFVTRASGFEEAGKFINAHKYSVAEFCREGFNKRKDGSPRLLKGYEFIRIPATASTDVSGFVLKLMYQNRI